MCSEGNATILVWLTFPISQYPKQTQTLNDKVPLPFAFFSRNRKTDYSHLLVKFCNYIGEPLTHERIDVKNKISTEARRRH